MKCAACDRSGSYLAPSDRRCAFDMHGRFVSTNLHCATLRELIARAHILPALIGDQHVGIIAHHTGHVVLCWRGSGAHVEFARLLSPLGEGGTETVLTLQVAEEIVGGAR